MGLTVKHIRDWEDLGKKLIIAVKALEDVANTTTDQESFKIVTIAAHELGLNTGEEDEQ